MREASATVKRKTTGEKRSVSYTVCDDLQEVLDHQATPTGEGDGEGHETVTLVGKPSQFARLVRWANAAHRSQRLQSASGNYADLYTQARKALAAVRAAKKNGASPSELAHLREIAEDLGKRALVAEEDAA